MGKNSSELEKRIQNEKDAHDVDDVLRKSYQLKKFFSRLQKTSSHHTFCRLSYQNRTKS